MKCRSPEIVNFIGCHERENGEHTGEILGNPTIHGITVSEQFRILIILWLGGSSGVLENPTGSNNPFQANPILRTYYFQFSTISNTTEQNAASIISKAVLKELLSVLIFFSMRSCMLLGT